jgi:hypothetical protein
MLEKLGILPDLEDARKAQLAFRARIARSEQRRSTRLLQTNLLLRNLLKFENPTTAVTRCAQQQVPCQRACQSMAKLAGAGGQDAVNGLKSTLFDYAYTKAGGDERFSIQAFNDALFSPLAPNQPSLSTLCEAKTS